MIQKNKLTEEQGIFLTWRSQNPMYRIAKQVRKKGLSVSVTYVTHMLTLC
jgi:hypothetical protein